MKILLVSNMFPDEKHPAYGIFVKKFCDQMDRLGVAYDKSVMLQSDSKLGKMAGYFRFYFGTFFKILFSGCDLVYVHYASHSSAPVLAASHFRKFRLYTNVHGSDVVPENARQEKMQKYTIQALHMSEKIVVPSNYFKEYIQRKYKAVGERIWVYPSGGIDINMFHPYSEEEKCRLKKMWGLDPAKVTFGMAGRISAGKGWDTFVRAVKRAVDAGIEANFVLVGVGAEGKQLEKMIISLELGSTIKRLGLLPQDELARFYNLIDYFVFPTKREGESLGLVALEAMACGTPVIASDFAAPGDYVVDGVNGYKFQKDNDGKLAEIMKICCSDYGKAARAGLSGCAVHTAEEYDSVRIGERLKEILA